MATIKSHTDIEQSKKLAEILPLESADMFYNEEPDETYPKDIVDIEYPMILREGQIRFLEEYGLPCWSLASLLNVLPEKYTELIKEGGMYRIIIKDSFMTCLFDNPVDACVAMVEKLHELKML